jgi:Stress responsive A/B Barrel Domain
MAAALRLMHNVFFTLMDKSPDARQKLIGACGKYLTGHPGTIHFAVGTRAEELNRPVNDRDFDVALHIFFNDPEAHERYQSAPRHLQFIEENKHNWKHVRVFDSLVGDGA